MDHNERTVPASRGFVRNATAAYPGNRASLVQGLLFLAAFGFTVAMVFGIVG